MDFERTEARNHAILAVHRALVDSHALEEAYVDYYPLFPTNEFAERVMDTWRNVSLEDAAIKFAVSGL